MAGLPSAIGQSTSDTGNLWLNGGMLRYVGGATSTDRLFTLSNSLLSPTGIDSSGTGPIAFNNSGPLRSTIEVRHTLVLTSAATPAIMSLAPLLADSASFPGIPNPIQTTLEKSGLGTWSLTNANTYSGGTTVDGGTLLAENTKGSATGTGPRHGKCRRHARRRWPRLPER